MSEQPQRLAEDQRMPMLPEDDGTPKNGKLRVRIRDHIGRTRFATVGADVRIAEVKDYVLDQLEMSPFDSNGQQVVYDLVHEGRVLSEDDTLEGIGAMTDDEILLSPRIQSA